MPLVALLVVVIVALSSAFYYRSTRDEVPTAPETATETPVAPNQASSTYTDGTYTKNATYTSPAGTESIIVAVTLKNDIVTSAKFTGGATNPGSIANQQKFASGFEGQVVGKAIDSIALTVVNGSSLTPKGFMNALSQIKADARI